MSIRIAAINFSIYLTPNGQAAGRPKSAKEHSSRQDRGW